MDRERTPFKHWCGVGPGFLCQVANVEGGAIVMARLKTIGKQRRVVIG